MSFGRPVIQNLLTPRKLMEAGRGYQKTAVGSKTQIGIYVKNGHVYEGFRNWNGDQSSEASPIQHGPPQRPGCQQCGTHQATACVGAGWLPLPRQPPVATRLPLAVLMLMALQSIHSSRCHGT